MNLKLATADDLPQLKSVYREIIDNMDQNGMQIWDEIYPCEFFCEDIEKKRLYILTEAHEIMAAFALCSSNTGEKAVKWESDHERALYMDRFGVNVKYLRKGIGSIMLQRAAALAKEKGAKYLRLFVVDINEPAIKLYLKNGFKRVEGIYHEIIDEGLVLHEYGFERKL